MNLFPNDTNSTAMMSPCGRYRYLLGRKWSGAKPLCGWIMLNPSKADASVNDPTIRRCMDFATTWGFGGILVANLFPLRATDPADLQVPDVDLFGPQEVNAVRVVMEQCGLVVAAWGSHEIAARHGRVDVVKREADAARKPLWAVRKNYDGTPGHPLYVPKLAKRVPWYVPAQVSIDDEGTVTP